jgi:hypothetical protein
MLIHNPPHLVALGNHTDKTAFENVGTYIIRVEITGGDELGSVVEWIYHLYQLAVAAV